MGTMLARQQRLLLTVGCCILFVHLSKSHPMSSSHLRVTSVKSPIGSVGKVKRYSQQRSSEEDWDFLQQFMAKHECPRADNGKRMFYCPNSGQGLASKCITLEQLCDGNADCRNGSDEDEVHCLFQRPMIAHLEDLMNSLRSITNTLLRSLFFMDMTIPTEIISGLDHLKVRMQVKSHFGEMGRPGSDDLGKVGNADDEEDLHSLRHLGVLEGGGNEEINDPPPGFHQHQVLDHKKTMTNGGDERTLADFVLLSKSRNRS